MDTSMLINELANRGLSAHFDTIDKYGKSCDVIVIETGTPISPVVHLSDYPNMDESTIAEAIAWRVQTSDVLSTVAKMQYGNICDTNYVLSHCRIGLRPTSQVGKMLNRPSEYDGISAYVYYSIDTPDGYGTINIDDALLQKLGLNEDEVWLHAYENTVNDSQVIDMVDVLSPLLLSSFQSQVSLPDVNTCPMAIVTNESRYLGAGSILNKNLLEEYAQYVNAEKLVLIPSSIHEWIIVPYDDDLNIDEVNEMIRNTNVQIEERMVLCDHAFIFERSTN